MPVTQFGADQHRRRDPPDPVIVHAPLEGFVGEARKDKTVRQREVRYNLSFVIRSFRDRVTVNAQATMPIYEYRCAACGHEIEALQKLSDAPLTVCPSCQKPELKKLLSAAGFQLKGSGWYATDFRNSGAKPAAKEKSAEKSTASSETAARQPLAAASRPRGRGHEECRQAFNGNDPRIEACSDDNVDAEERFLKPSPRTP